MTEWQSVASQFDRFIDVQVYRAAVLAADMMDDDKRTETGDVEHHGISQVDPEVHVNYGSGVTAKREGAQAKTVHNVSIAPLPLSLSNSSGRAGVYARC